MKDDSVGDSQDSIDAWDSIAAASVLSEIEDWVRQKEYDRMERHEARLFRRSAREKRRGRRKQEVLNARWAHKKAVLARRKEQKEDDTRVIVAGGGVSQFSM